MRKALLLLLMLSACEYPPETTEHVCRGYGDTWKFNASDARVLEDGSIALKDGKTIPYGKGIKCYNTDFHEFRV